MTMDSHRQTQYREYFILYIAIKMIFLKDETTSIKAYHFDFWCPVIKYVRFKVSSPVDLFQPFHMNEHKYFWDRNNLLTGLLH